MTHVFAALREFIARYAKIFKAAWSIRATLDPPYRSEDELAFLPAHLELIDTPVSPTARWFMRTIIALFCVALAWAIFGQLDIVAVAPGKTVVGSGTKVIQTTETATVRRILVDDGQTVRRGQLLIELDATAAAADFEKAGDALGNAHAAAARLAALATALDNGQPPHLAADDVLPPERLIAEQQLAASQFAAFQAHRLNLQAAIAQRQAELHTGESLIGPLGETAAIATSRAKDYASLVANKYVARNDYLQHEQERIAAERDLAAQRSRQGEVSSALEGAREQLRVLETETRQQTLDGLRQAREQIGQFTPDVARTGQRSRLMQLRAPVAGTVQQLAVHTIGGVVTPAQPLLAVVPAQDALEIDATVLNKDIGFVHAGQPATVKVESFPYTRYGYLIGTVAIVSHDAAKDEKLGLIFPARVRLQQTALMIDGVKVNLTPGMSLSVEIKTGKRRVIDYLLSPLRTHSEESLRER